MIYGKLVKFCHILVAIVGIVAAIAPFLITTIYNQIYSKPNVILDIIPNIEGNGQRTRFDIRNIGVVPATNLSLLIDSPKKIMTVTNIFSTSHLSLPDFNNTILHSNIPMTINERFLEIKAAKLVHGGGSDILIETLIDSKTNQSYEDYRASLIYDQGSTVGKKQKEITNQYTPQEILAS